MSAVGEKGYGGLQRPYTHGTFQKKLNEFEELIKELTLQDVEASPEERRQMITENLRYDQFCDSIRALFGADIRNQDLKSIYRKISTNPDASVDWSELFGYFQSENEEQEITVGEEVSVFTVSARQRVGEAAGDRKRRDIIQCLKYNPSLDCYLSASQKGAISVWTSKLRLQACADIYETAWVTGCDYLPGIRRVAACTERSISIWDNRAKGKNQSVFSIKPITNSPQCMTWVPYTNNTHEDTLLFGDDQGNMNLITIAAKDLTMKNSKGDKNFSQNYVIEPNKLTYPICRRKVHDDWVLKVKYFPELRCFGSCSPSSNNSFALEEVEKLMDHKSDIRTVGITKGVNAFDFCARANIIATGGVDKVIRVWHPHIFSRPTGKLIGHLFTIIDIVCNEKDQHIISLSTARVFRIWDIHTLTSLQVFTDNEERPGEKRIYSMVFDNKHDRLITGSSVVDAWPLTRAVQDTMQVPHTHDRPISQIFHNKELNQLITVCTESTIKVWESETGKLMYQMTEAHGPNIEVTALTMDSSGYRMATAGNDASVKVWDFGSGQEIKCRTGRGTDDQDFSITAMQYCTVDNEKCIIAMGWNNRLRLLQDSHSSYDLPVLRDFIDIYYLTQEVSLSPAGDPFTTQPLPDIGQSIPNVTNVFKKEYVLTTHELSCLTSLLPDILATGCTNGNIILWDINKSAVDKIFYLPEPERSSSQGNRVRLKSGSDRGVTVIKILEHRVRRLDPAFIKRLTKHLASDDEDEDGDSGGRYRSRRTSRATSFSRRSRTTSRTSAAGTVVTIDRNLLDELTAKIEGDDYDKQEGNREAAKKESDVPGNVSEQKPDGATKQDGEKEKEKGEGGDNKEATESVQAPTEDSKEINGKDNQGEEKQQNNETKESQDDPDANMIVDTYDPILVSCHQDSYIRFWSMQGNLLREITAITRRQGSAVTSMCTDNDCHIMVTGDSKGYLTLWDVGKFLETPESEEQDLIQQLTCWRAHLTKVVQLVYIDAQKAILSGSTDGSVRVWWGTKGRFVGFYGQHRPFLFPNNEETASTPILPYDITEGPLAPVKARNNDQQKIRAVQKFEYPLMFTNDKWRPFRRSAYWEERTRKQEPEDKKFFGALIKPRAYKAHLESFTTGEMRQGAVFRALPVYRVRTPKKLKTPEFSFPMPEEDENTLLYADFNQPPKEVRFRSPKNERSLKGNAFATEQANKGIGKNARDGDKSKPIMKKMGRLAATNITGVPSTSNSPSLYPQSPRKR